jgi:hypothetical protein
LEKFHLLKELGNCLKTKIKDKPMKARKFITFTLLAFVAVSIGYLVLSNRQPPDSSSPSAGITLPLNALSDAEAAELESAVVPVSEEKVIALYFHGTTRCDTCRAIEALTRKALETGFSKELKTGKLELRSINVDEPANGHFVEDYQLSTRTVVIARFKDGEQAAWKRLDQVWQLVKDKETFIDYVQAETRTLLEQSS